MTSDILGTKGMSFEIADPYEAIEAFKRNFPDFIFTRLVVESFLLDEHSDEIGNLVVADNPPLGGSAL